MIDVTQTGDGQPLAFAVTVDEGNSRTAHTVTLHRDTAARLGGAEDPARLIEAAFRFLLDREPKEAIMSRFDVDVISRYFPEFDAKLSDYLPGG